MTEAPRNSKEREAKILLRDILTTRFKGMYRHILVDQNLASYPDIRKEWEQKWAGIPSPPLQPNIDLLYVHEDQKLTATEAKFFDLETPTRLNQSFYEGIDEALALLLFGFDNVSLLFIFDESISDYQLQQYGGRAWVFVRTICGDEKSAALDFACLRYLEAKKDFQLFEVDFRKEGLPIKFHFRGELLKLTTWKHPNPLLDISRNWGFRGLLLHYLKRVGIANLPTT